MNPTIITDRQYEIIQAAGKILSSDGVTGLTIKNLAKEMGFTESAVYRHFDSKEAIILAMLGYLAEIIDERLGRAISPGKNGKENLQAIYDDLFTFFSENPHFVVAVFSDGLLESSQNINAAIQRIMQVNVKHLAPVIRKGQHEGIFTPAVPAEDLIHIILGTFRLQMLKWRMTNFHFDILKKGHTLMAHLFEILDAPKK